MTFIIDLNRFEMAQTGADMPWPPAGDYCALMVSITAMDETMVPGSGHCELEPLIDLVFTSHSPLVGVDRGEHDHEGLRAHDRG